MYKFYEIYGLKIKSELEIGYLDEIDKIEDDKIDAEIIYGNIPDKFIKAYENNENVDLDGEEMCMEIGDLARYHIKNGKRIVVEKIDNNRDEKIEAFLLGRAFSILLYQRRKIVIHGSAIVDNINNKCVIISGDSGAGKSTLATKFIESGHGILADDISVIEVNRSTENVRVVPAVGIQKVRENIIYEFNIDKKKLKKLDSSRGKYCIDRRDKFINISKPLDSIVVIEPCSCVNTIEFTELKGSEKLDIIMDSIFNISYIRSVGIDMEYFKDIIYLSKNIKVYRIIRPIDKNTVEDQMERIKEVI